MLIKILRREMPFIITLALLFITVFAYSQQTATVYGRIVNTDNQPLDMVNIAVLGLPGGTTTDNSGVYEILVPAEKDIVLVFSFIGFDAKKINMHLKSNERKELNLKLNTSTTHLPPIEVVSEHYRESNLFKINPKIAQVIPTPSGNIESIIKTLPGVSSSNELSYQYSVRGGNYDENLIYVNDIEIYRPLLIRSGQQEGLSFINSDMVSSILFSAGGFDAQYGDKMSSVLDIQYKNPKKFAGSVSGSLLGGAAHVEGIAKKRPISYIIGIRQKSNQYILKSMESKGDYKPSFTDFQTYISYNVNKKWELGFFGNIARNTYRFIPQTRETRFGTINEALKLKIYFDGQEIDKFDTYFGAFTAEFKPNETTRIKNIFSAFQSIESETFDIQGQYWLYQLENDFGKDDFGNEAFERGVGTYLIHSRNHLTANVLSFEHKGTQTKYNRTFKWGLKAQRENIVDKLKEWTLIDSAGYSLPNVMDSVGYTNSVVQPYYDFELNELINTTINLSSNRISGFLQNTWIYYIDSLKFSLTAGVRANYWDFNNQLLVSPRGTIACTPSWEKDIVFRFSAGVYNQPPFYREIRDFSGNINTNIKAQQSIHFVLASDYNFTAWNRPFKYITEVYYKKLNNLIPYEVDNVRIRYYSDKLANGYATGIDMKVNGEFVKGIESWASLSIMQTMEDIVGDFFYEYYNQGGQLIIQGYTQDNIAVDSVRVEPGYIPRPSDQRVNFSLFFQDFLPKNPTYKMHLNLLFGSGLPFGPPKTEKYRHTLRIPMYRRVDIGFSKQLKSETKQLSDKNMFRHFKTVWISAEVFNLLQINNTISYLWIKDVNNRQYAIPNYLTPRMLNVRLLIEF